MELVINTSFTTVINGIGTPSDAILYLNGTSVSTTVTTSQVSSTPNIWSVTFTPTSTGVYTLFAFGTIQFRLLCVPKATATLLGNIEDEALGSWNWDKNSGTLTILRQNGTLMATHQVTDTLTAASRERVS